MAPEVEPLPLEGVPWPPELLPEPLLELLLEEAVVPLELVLEEVTDPLELLLEVAARPPEDEVLVDDPLPPGLPKQAQSGSISARVMDNTMRPVMFGSNPCLANMSEICRQATACY